MKKLLMIIIILLFVLLFVGVIWFFFFADTSDQFDIAGPNPEESERVFFPTSPPAEDVVDPESITPEAPTPTDSLVTESVPVLRQISKTPTAGFISFLQEKEVLEDARNTTDGTSTKNIDTEEVVYRYVERATGHIYEATDSNLTLKRLSNTTIPRIQEAIIDTQGMHYIFRYINSVNGLIDTFAATLRKNDTSEETPKEEKENNEAPAPDDDNEYVLHGEFLPVNIPDVVYGPNNEFMYISGNRNNAFDETTIFTANKSLVASPIFTSPLSEWIVDWPSKDLVTITSKADSRLPGILYHINPNTGNRTKVLSDVKGLTSLSSPSGTYVLYSNTHGGQPDLFAHNIKENTFRRLGADTLPEKCAWSTTLASVVYCAVPEFSPGSGMPEKWYKGDVIFNDNIWRIDVDTLSYTEILSVDQIPSGTFDIINPEITEEDEYINFINKQDLTLWSLKLK